MYKLHLFRKLANTFIVAGIFGLFFKEQSKNTQFTVVELFREGVTKMFWQIEKNETLVFFYTY